MNPFFKFCLVVICVFTSDDLFSQNFISENKIWRIGSKIYTEPCCTYRNAAYKFQGDSIINDTAYAKLYESEDKELKSWRLNSLWRETGGKKIYCRYINGQPTEILMYDYSMQKGDTYEIHNIQFNIDSVKLISWGNKLRTHLYLNPVSGKEEYRTIWIEGVGQSNGLVNNINGNVGAEPFLLCFSENGQQVYQNPKYNSCYYNEVSEHSFVSSDKLWSTMKGPVANCNSFYCESYFTKFTEDTLIGEITFKKVMESTDSLMTKWSLRGLIRENQQKVYYRGKGTVTDCLLYDFSCSSGDMINLNCACVGSGYKVDSVKQEKIMDTARKVFYLSYLDNKSKEVWIEGIGSTLGVLNGGGFQHCMTGSGEALLCFYENGVKAYQSKEHNHCFLTQDIVNSIDQKIKRNSFFSVYPIPASDEIHVEFDQFPIDFYTLDIISVKGEIIKTSCIDNVPGQTIDIRSLSPGIYFVRVSSGINSDIRQFIVK